MVDLSSVYQAVLDGRWNEYARLAQDGEEHELPLPDGWGTVYMLYEHWIDDHRVECRYIGKSSVGAQKRYRDHWKEAMRPGSAHTHKNIWLRSRAGRDDVVVYVRELLRAPVELLSALEAAMIIKLREAGHSLTNDTVGEYHAPGRKARARSGGVRGRGWTHTPQARQLLSEAAKQQWRDYTPEQRAAHGQKLQDAYHTWLEKVERGEIVDPRRGRVPWNKGIDQGPEVGLKSWETKRARGFISQREMMEPVAKLSGCSKAQTERTLKGHGDKVRKEAREKIWAAYEQLKDELPDLRVVR